MIRQIKKPGHIKVAGFLAVSREVREVNGGDGRRCRCTDYEVQKYRQKLSGPILDRIEVHKYVQPVNFLNLSGQAL